MRRKDRQITDKPGMLEILSDSKVCRLGLAADNRPYVVPLNFGFEWAEDAPVLYFHAAHTGMKLDILAKNSSVCWEVDSGHSLKAGARACDYGFSYASLIGFGTARIVLDAAEKQRGLALIMEHQAGPGAYEFTEAELASVTVIAVDTEEVTGKRCQ